MKAFGVGVLVGCAICAALWPLMYAAGLRPATAWTECIFRTGLVLWPTSLMLMAIQSRGITLFSVQVTAAAVLANGLLYGLIAAIGTAAIRGVRTLSSQRWS